MRDLLIPDLTDTITVDPELLRMRSEVDSLDRGLESVRSAKVEAKKKKAHDARVKDLAKIIKQAKGEIKNYEKAKGRKPSVTIGYMPASKATTLRNQVIGDSGTEALKDRLDNLAGSSRDTLAWTIKGWNLRNKGGDVAFESEPVTVCGFEFAKASPLMVSVLEHMGWLEVLTSAAWGFNNVSEAEKKR